MSKWDSLMEPARIALEALIKEGDEAADRIEELEANLAKAVGTLHEIAGKKDFADDPWSIARTTLAELTGGKDD